MKQPQNPQRGEDVNEMNDEDGSSETIIDTDPSKNNKKKRISLSPYRVEELFHEGHHDMIRIEYLALSKVIYLLPRESSIDMYPEVLIMQLETFLFFLLFLKPSVGITRILCRT